MDRFRAMQTFVKVAESGSFVRAAEALGLSKASVSLIVSELEAGLGVRLMQRTTRKLSLTDMGRAYLARCHDILEAVAEAEGMLSARQGEARGVLRAYAPLAFAQHHVVPVLPAYRAAFPEVTVDLVLGTRAVDLVEEGFDLALLFEQQGLASSLVSRRLAHSDLIFCAAPGYLAARGRPDDPTALAGHDLLISDPQYLSGKLTRDDGETLTLAWPAPALLCNASEVLRESCVAGMGVAVLPSFVVSESLRLGELVEVLPGWRAGRLDLCLAFPSRRFLSAKVRGAADYIVERFRAFATDPHCDPWLASARAAATMS
ncbi:LysR family transcriptional regulator [Chitinimonas koreensis]|uniref:LysR family transcriptional regulator n=1 Tax=Chitinimonas koreensis TaxID=356302 RepID=UPI0004270E93|nr:LysR family transcriptional regulator [Chitinimonas koreensis]QNM97996.1 LysR family transcriptional regulator [Chitinimonas koreensis]